eukprot:g18031.t1
MPQSVYNEVRTLHPGGERRLPQKIKFGTAATNRDDDSAPAATFEILLYFLLNGSLEIFQQYFQIITGGSIASFPTLLGTPFLAGQTPPVASIFMDSGDIEVQDWDADLDFAEYQADQVLRGGSSSEEEHGSTRAVSWGDGGSGSQQSRESRISAGDGGGGSSAESDVNMEDSVEDPTELRRRKLLKQFLQNEHRALGHSKTLELLYEGEALSLLRAIRRECRMCQQWDDTKEILYRGSLMQFANERNETWIIDGMPSRIGLLVKIIDVCTRKRHIELVDFSPWKGGKTGAAVRCFVNARRTLNGAPENLVYDLGSELLSAKFQSVVKAANTHGRPIGLKAAYKISKLERTNGTDRRAINKLLTPPVDKWMEMFVWALASHQDDQECYEGGFEETLHRVAQIRPNSDAYPSEFELKEQLVQEFTWQTNQKPILGTALSAENLHSGSFNRGVRDWELTFGELLNDQDVKDRDIDVHMQRQAIVEHDCRRTISERDLEMVARRRELVGRVYYRGVGPESYQIGMNVYPRRPETSKFHRWADGVVEAIDAVARVVHVRRGGTVTQMAFRDAAVEKRLEGQEYEAEFYPDADLLDLEMRSIPKKIHKPPRTWDEWRAASEKSKSSELEADMGSAGGIDHHMGDLDSDELPPGLAQPASLFATYTSPDHDEHANETEIQLEPGETLFTDGVLHERVREEMDKYRTSVNLSVKEGKIYLSSALETPSPAPNRAFDFSVLPKVTAMMEKDKQREFVSRLHKGSNDVCFVFSQLLNGQCVRSRMSPKHPGESREVHHVAVEVGVFRGKLRGATAKGRVCFLRWGHEMTPVFESEEEARREVDGTFVARIFFETCDDALEAVKLYTHGLKSSLIVVKLEDAVKLGFAMFVYPACVLEVQAIDKNGVLGKRYKLSELKGKNVVSSRWLVAVKIERVTGVFTKAKARWITQGYKDLRYKRANGDRPDKRCYTVSDATITAMLYYAQAERKLLDLADISEAFLKGKEMTALHEKREDQEVYMTVPTDVIAMSVPGVEPLDEAVELNKELYGQPGAPRGWEEEWWDGCREAGLQQSHLDPSMWLYFCNSQERRAISLGYVKQYFCYKLTQLLQVPSTHFRRRIEILDMHSEPDPVDYIPPRGQRSVLNPQTLVLHNQVMPHFQRRDPPAGMLGTHVDDTLSCGGALFYLRLFCLYDRFGLGSFTRLRYGTRDNFVGRELAAVPYEYDQKRVGDYLELEKDRVEASGIVLEEGAVEIPTADALKVVEERVGFGPDVATQQYPAAQSVPLDPFMFLDNEQPHEVVYYISQQSYAERIKTISHEEVNEYFRRRVGASKWQKINGSIRSPLRAKLGELIWLEKTNAVIVERLGDLASDAHYAEMATRAEDIDLFIDELSGLVLLAQLQETNVLRVYRLGGIGENFLGGAADAATKKIGGTTFLAAADVKRIGTLSRFGGGKPGRVFHSSTGIEVLAQKQLISENIFLAQVLMDMHLIRINRPLLSLTDAKNATTEPKERNLRPDFHSIAMLVRDKLLAVVHADGDNMWADGLTKEARVAHLFLLHLAFNFGLIDLEMMKLIQTHIRRVLGLEEEQKMDSALDKAVEELAEAEGESGTTFVTESAVAPALHLLLVIRASRI